jgi:hypothetical protein
MSIDIHDKDNKVYIVLGAPHSATSFIAKAIHEQGIPMTKGEEGDYFKRYYQDPEIVHVNKRLLRAVPGGRWNTPPTEAQLNKVTKFDERIEHLMNERKDQPFWGFKDNRSVFMLDKYLQHLDDDVYLIACFRKPSRVMKSYQRTKRKMTLYRDGLEKYNKALIKKIKEFVKW